MSTIEDFAEDFGVLDQWAYGIERVSSGGVKLDREGRFIVGDEAIAAKYKVSCSLSAKAFKDKILKQGIKYSGQYRYWFVYDSTKKLLMLFLYPFYKSETFGYPVQQAQTPTVQDTEVPDQEPQQ